VLLAHTTLSLLATLMTPPTLAPPAAVAEALALGPPEIGVHGELACPAPELVAARVRPLLPDDVALPPGTWIDLRAPAGTGGGGPSRLQVALVGAIGSPDVPIGTVRLVASCEDTADEAAVLIAAWLARYETPPASVDVVVEGDPAGAASRRRDREDPDARLNASRFRGTVGLAAGLVQGLAGAATPQAAIEGALLRASGPRRRLVARLSLSLSGTRALALGPGSSQWQRLAGVLAVGWRERLGRAPGATVDGPDGADGSFFVELTGGPIVADSRVAGTGYGSDFRSSGIDAGVAPALRIGWNTEPGATLPLELWLELGCHMWVRAHEVVTTNPPMSRRLPWLDAALSLGTSFGPGR
jgi:hypothetical protein